MSGYDVIVVGGGHAGCEAAYAAARNGASVLLLAIRADAIGSMSCNPAIGGIGKGHIVREVDVFGGLIGRAADEAAIHYRMLNRSKGVAVHGPRVQADRDFFRCAVQRMLRAAVGLTIGEGEVTAILQKGSAAGGVQLRCGRRVTARSVVLATGTFLGGRLFRGEERFDGGRVGEGGAHALAEQVRALGLPLARLKTGTPPRLDGRSINWSRLPRQESDREPWCLSRWTAKRHNPQLFCGIARTNTATHDHIRAAADRSPLYAGAIGGRGPRYCPSIEDKVVRFGDRDGHQLFLEPETLVGELIYPNGLSTSLPTEVQEAVVRSIAGLEQARIVVPGYAVEYSHVDPRSLTTNLEVRAVAGLFLAGQVNGTTGYEEAAGQGLVAGLNAAARALGRDPVRFARDDSYIGVMIDDLTLQGVSEPYRMLSARAEHRLALRADNAGSRLGPLALSLPLLSIEERQSLENSLAAKQEIAKALGSVSDEQARERWGGQAELEEVLADRSYAPYVIRQRAEIARRRDAAISLPAALDYGTVAGLSTEMVERLTAARPDTLDQASRIPGITPAALTALLVASQR